MVPRSLPDLEVVKTYLQLLRPPQPGVTTASGPEPGGVAPGVGETRTERVLGCPISFHRYLYREVGRHYHWVERLDDSDEAIATLLADPGHELWLLSHRGAPAGYYELLREEGGTIHLRYFGLLPEFVGRGLGRGLLTHAIARAWALGAARLLVNTCTLDGLAALPTYRKAGFEVVGEERFTVPMAPERCDHCTVLVRGREGGDAAG